MYDRGFRRDGEWALNIRSVIVFGRVKRIEDTAQAMNIIRRLSYKYTDDTAYIEKEIAEAADHTLCFALVPEHMTGKLTNES